MFAYLRFKLYTETTDMMLRLVTVLHFSVRSISTGSIFPFLLWCMIEQLSVKYPLIYTVNLSSTLQTH